MEAKKLMFIVNPISGTKSKKKKVASALRVLRGYYKVDLRYTEYAGHGTALAGEAVGKGYYGVVACGGDGTVNEIAKALISKPVAMGIIPAGSGNGLARHLELPMDGRHAARVIADDDVRDCDYATVNDRPFFCTCGVGFDAAVSLRFAEQKRRGLAMYVKSALDEYRGYKPQPYTLKINGRTVTKEALMIACCNASQYGNNAFIAPHASVTDGLLDIVVVHPRHITSQTAFGVEMMTGFISQDAKVDVYRCRELEISRPEPGPAHIDGEPLILPDTLEVKCHPGQLRLFVNSRRGKFRPLLTPMKMAFSAMGRNISNMFSKK